MENEKKKKGEKLFYSILLIKTFSCANIEN